MVIGLFTYIWLSKHFSQLVQYLSPVFNFWTKQKLAQRLENFIELTIVYYLPRWTYLKNMGLFG